MSDISGWRGVGYRLAPPCRQHTAQTLEKPSPAPTGGCRLGYPALDCPRIETPPYCIRKWAWDWSGGAMVSGGGGSLPMPQTTTEWLGLAAAIVLIVWVVRRWLDRG